MTCAKITIDVTKLHMYLQVCKNKIAHNTCSVQKFGVFIGFANNTLQMMKEMMFLRVEMMKFAMCILQIKTEKLLQKHHHLQYKDSKISSFCKPFLFCNVCMSIDAVFVRLKERRRKRKRKKKKQEKKEPKKRIKNKEIIKKKK